MWIFAPGFGAGAVAGYAILRIDPAVVAPDEQAVLTGESAVDPESRTVTAGAIMALVFRITAQLRVNRRRRPAKKSLEQRLPATASVQPRNTSDAARRNEDAKSSVGLIRRRHERPSVQVG